MSRREEYLKLIYSLSQNTEVSGSDIADELNIKLPSVCVYLKRLIGNGDIIMDQHHCVHLTEQELNIAQSTFGKHGMLLALLKNLGIPDKIAAKDACFMEHNLSTETYSALEQLLLERQQ